MNNSRELIRLAVLEINEKYSKDRYLMNNNLNETLKNKFEKVDENEEKYIEILRYNIIYYKSIIKKLENILEMWIQNDLIQGHQSVEKSIDNIKASSRQYVNKAMKYGNSHLNDKDRKIFASYDKSSGVKKIEKIENDYKILNIYKDVLSMVITLISENVDKYKNILNMSTEAVKIDLMNEIFTMINDVLFSHEPIIEEFTDQALVEGDDIPEEYELADEDKSISFTKYVSMISTPEISVKINDVFRDVVEAEYIEEEDAYGFSDNLRDYVSCVVLLMDYVSDENRRLFINAFRMIIIGLVDEKEFKEIIERLIRNKTFLDKSRWLACHKLVKSDFNLENNNFFRRKLVDNSYDKVNFSQKMNLLDTEMDTPIGEIVEDMVYGSGRTKNKTNVNFIASLKDNLFKKKTESDEHSQADEYYDDEFEEYSYEDINDDEDYYENNSFSDRVKNFFSKKDRDQEYSRYSVMDEDDYNDVDPNLFGGDKSIQDENALAILMMREKSRRKEDDYNKKEYDTLKKERHLAENIVNPKIDVYKGDTDIVFEESDCVYPNKDENNSSYEEFEVVGIDDSEFKSDNNRGFSEESYKNTTFEESSHNNISFNEEQILNDEVGSFKELEELMAVKNDENNESDANIDESDYYSNISEKSHADLTEPSEEKFYEEFDDVDTATFIDKLKESSIVTRIMEVKEARFNKKSRSENIDDEGGFIDSIPKAKLARDSIIIIVILVGLFFLYIFFIKQFTMPSVEETNNASKNIKVEKKIDTSSNNSGQGDTPKSTAEITQKTEAEKLRDENENKASDLDREAEQYKNGKGTYYTVFVGATKDKDGAESVANNFARRGLQVKVVRNAGFYMLKIGEYFDYNQAYAKSKSISAKGIQNYIASQNKYYDLKIMAYQVRVPNLSKEQLKTDYNDLRNQISSTGKNASYISNLDEIYEQAIKDK